MLRKRTISALTVWFAFLTVLAPGNGLAQQIDCKNATTTNDMKFCADQSYKAADKRLNEVYQKVLSGETGEPKKLLIEAEEMWIKFRDDSCRFEIPVSPDGREYPIFLNGCLEKLTRERTADLEKYLSQREGNSTSQPPVRTSTVASLPDGNYRYVSAKFSSFNVSDDELLKAGGYEFRFRKKGNKLTGTLGQIDSGNTICMSGDISGNTVAGRAVEVSEPPFNPKDTIRSAGEEFVGWDLLGGSILKVRRGKKVGNKIEYASALMNLSGLNRINTGTRPAPVSCP
ncbi:lysozyme inhibitor LprI family protein [Kamptonema formosum]|uniref:lysozyme inhibitor LprI family protein n=1 Tax=Kamptonema formosum TaxID=331992 RepID=UPI000348D346|nr:lysozyme inhibitor LprI family protein [Oscillatoria sp. PCC 10802]